MPLAVGNAGTEFDVRGMDQVERTRFGNRPLQRHPAFQRAAVVHGNDGVRGRNLFVKFFRQGIIAPVQLVDLLPRLLVFPHQVVDHPEVVIGFHHPRIHLQGGFQFPGGFLEQLHLRERNAPVVSEPRVVVSQLQGFVEREQGFLVELEMAVSDPEVGLSQGVQRIQFDGFLESLDRLFPLMVLAQADAFLVMDFRLLVKIEGPGGGQAGDAPRQGEG